MKVQEIKDNDGNLIVSLVVGENDLENKVLILTAQLAYHFESLRSPDTLKGFSGHIKVVVNDQGVPTIAFFENTQEESKQDGVGADNQG